MRNLTVAIILCVIFLFLTTSFLSNPQPNIQAQTLTPAPLPTPTPQRNSQPFTVITQGTVKTVTTYEVTTWNEFLALLGGLSGGDRVQFRGGTYTPLAQLNITDDGDAGNPIIFEAYGTETVIIDGSSVSLARYAPLIWTSGDNLLFSKLRLTKSTYAGFDTLGSNVIYDHCQVYENEGVGLNTHAANTTFRYCTAYSNCDTAYSGVDADGLGASAGATNAYFLKCLSYGNSDDGIDVYGSNNSTIECCVAHDNGLLDGDGYGVKLGAGDGNSADRCIAYNNQASGFVSNEGTNVVVNHCTAWGNPEAGFQNWGDPLVTWSNNIGSFNKHEAANPTQINNSWNLGIGDPDFISEDSGNANFLSLAATSDCRGAASDGSDLGAIQYGGNIANLYGLPASVASAIYALMRRR